MPTGQFQTTLLRPNSHLSSPFPTKTSHPDQLNRSSIAKIRESRLLHQYTLFYFIQSSREATTMKQVNAALLILLTSCAAASTVNTRILKGKSHKEPAKEHPLKYHDGDEQEEDADIPLPLFITSSMSLPELESISMPTDPEFGEWAVFERTNPDEPELETIAKPSDPEVEELAAPETTDPVDPEFADWAVVEVPVDASMSMTEPARLTEPQTGEWGTFEIDMSLSLSFSLSFSTDNSGGAFILGSNPTGKPTATPKSGKSSKSPTIHASKSGVKTPSSKSSKSATFAIDTASDRGDLINAPLLVSSGSMCVVGITSMFIAVVSALIL